MKITQQNIDGLSITVTVQLERNDYEALVKKNMNDYRRKAELKGFRPGMAPMSLIEKTHGTAALYDEISKIVTNSLKDYVEQNNLKLFFEAIPANDEKVEFEWETAGDFEFVFDMGLVPEINISLTSDDKIPYYNIEVTKKEKEREKENILLQNGKMVDIDTVNEEALLTVDLSQGDRKVEAARISMKTIETKALKKPLLGKKVGEEIVLDVKKTFTNETDLAILLRIAKEELGSIDPSYTVTLKEIKQLVPAELNQQLYDDLFGAGIVQTEEEFMQKLEEHINENYRQESEYRFARDAYRLLQEKAALSLPDHFLKRWRRCNNKTELTPEQLEQQYAEYANSLRHQMVSEYMLAKNNIKITEEEMADYARAIARQQLNMFGLHNPTDEQLNQYTLNTIISKKERLMQLYEQVEFSKVISYVKATATLVEQKITMDELHAMIEKEEKEKAAAENSEEKSR
jgi:trigger factor